MKFSESHKFGFLHIKKTGGTSMTEVLEELVDDLTDVQYRTHHESLDEATQALIQAGLDPGKMQFFTIIRNPFSQIVSLYHFYKNTSNGYREAQEVAAKSTFLEFADYWATNDSPDNASYGELLKVGGAIPDNLHILQTEFLGLDAARVFHLLGIPLLTKALPNRNVSNHGPVSHHYNGAQGVIDKVVEKYHWCFKEAPRYSPDPRNAR